MPYYIIKKQDHNEDGRVFKINKKQQIKEVLEHLQLEESDVNKITKSESIALNEEWKLSRAVKDKDNLTQILSEQIETQNKLEVLYEKALQSLTEAHGAETAEFILIDHGTKLATQEAQIGKLKTDLADISRFIDDPIKNADVYSSRQ